jgi:HD-GYP domain-containing protein (c-di-GMP phosphodiesterase class II)
MRGAEAHGFPAAQALRYAEELGELHRSERGQRRRAEAALAQLQDSYGTTVRALAAALELRDDITGGHAERVTRLALLLAERVAPDLSEDPQLEYGFLLHDVGKIGVPDAVLQKPGQLNVDERRLIERHPEHGARILREVPYLDGVALDIVIAHHERWDGGGYPLGLVGTGIPLAARIFALADAFDAMTNDRPYRAALSRSEALAELERCAGVQFDPGLTCAFVDLINEARVAP